MEYRRMKPYHPRRSRKELALYRQELKNHQQRLNRALGDYIVLLEEGSSEQIESAHIHAKSEFHKFAPEMHKLANQIGNRTPRVIENYLKSIEGVVLAPQGFVDRSKVTYHFEMNQKLEKAI